jgi:hypothetical protein
MQCPKMGQVYILVLNEALWFGDEGGMDHTLLNPNQLRNYQLDVHDNPFDRTKDLHIDTQSDLQIPLKTKGTVIYFNTWAPTRAEIDANPHIHLSSTAEWNPLTFRFPGSTEDEEEDYTATTMNISSFMTDLRRTAQFDTPKPLVKPDVPEQRTFIASDRHSTIKAERLNEMWGVSNKQAHKMLRVTTQ